jgi:DNA uptake protein ComE-like DNA-binding protein
MKVAAKVLQPRWIASALLHRTRQREGVTVRNFLIGLGVGIGVGFVVAPAAGAETRSQVSLAIQRLLGLFNGRANGNGISGGSRPKRSSAPATPMLTKKDELQAQSNGAGALLDALNKLTREDLLEIAGIGPVLASRILDHQPYSTLDDLRERAQLPAKVFESLRRELLER